MFPRVPAWLFRSLVPLVVFLAACVLILYLVADRFLLPALVASWGLDPESRKRMAAISALVMAVVLTCLVAIGILIIRPGRFFLPRKGAPPNKTAYPDAWAESARRVEVPPADGEEDEE